MSHSIAKLMLFGWLAGIAAADLLVTSFGNDQVLRYDSNTGVFLNVFASGGALDGPKGIAVAANGNVLVASFNNDQILAYTPAGAFAGVFANGGGLASPFDMEFGPDGDLYVASSSSNDILRFHGVTGAFLNELNDANDFDPNQPRGLTIGNGFLFTSVEGDRIRRYDFATGNFLSNPFGDNPRGLTIGPDGKLYVGYAGPANLISLHDGITGAGISDFIPHDSNGLSSPMGILFGPDGNFYVASRGNDAVLRFDSAGVFLDEFVPTGSGGLDDPHFFVFRNEVPEPGTLALFGIGGTLLLLFRRRIK